MKELLLRPQEIFVTHVEVDVLDFPKGLDSEPRKRMTVTVEYAKFDVDQLKKRGLDFKGVMDYYEDWLYNLVRARLLDDWTAVDGLSETMEIVKDHIKDMFEA